MRRLLVLALALVVAACGSTSPAPNPCPPSPAPTPCPTPPAVVPGVPVVNGWPVMPGSPECVPLASVTYLPTETRLTEIRYRVQQMIRADLTDGYLVPNIDLAAAKRLLNYFPWIRWYASPLYGTWAAAGVPYTGCASGVAYQWGPSISGDDVTRVEPLAVWEWTNWYVGVINRPDLADGPYCSRVTAAVEEQVGGWQTGATP